MNAQKKIASKIEYADTPFKIMVGLMFRREIPKDYAMVFDLKRDRRIWVDTLFCSQSLDAVFLDRDKKVIQIMQGLKPWRILTKPSIPARYFVETLAGEVERHDIHISDRVII